MTITIDDLPEDLVGNLRERGHSDADILAMSAETMFTEYCEWEGIMGWGRTLWSLVQDINKILPPKENEK